MRPSTKVVRNKMKLHKIILPLAVICLFCQCKSSSVPLGYYYTINDCIRPAYCFYYCDSIHSNHGFYHDKKSSDELTEVYSSVFRQKKDVSAFFDGNVQVDTLQLTIEYSASFAPRYHCIYTPSSCKVYLYNPSRLWGTYVFVPNQQERGLVSFAVSQLLSGDTVNDKDVPNNVIIEPAYCSLLIKSDKVNIDIFTHLFAGEVPDALYLLIDAMEAIAFERCNPDYRTTEKPCETIIESFDKKIYEKFIPSPPCEQ